MGFRCGKCRVVISEIKHWHKLRKDAPYQKGVCPDCHDKIMLKQKYWCAECGEKPMAKSWNRQTEKVFRHEVHIEKEPQDSRNLYTCPMCHQTQERRMLLKGEEVIDPVDKA